MSNHFFFFTSKNFIFENFIFRKFCLFVFDFILFFKKKKIRNLLFTFDRSTITIHRLLFIDYCSSITVHNLSCNTICLLQYTSSCVLQDNTPSLAIPLISLAIHLHSLAIQFLNLLASLIAIQFLVLQYNFPALKPSYCNTLP